MTHIQTAHPENNVLGNVGGVVRDSFQVARGKNELHARANQREVLSHVLEQIFKDAIAVLIDHIIAFQNLRGQVDVLEDQRAQAAADHGTNRLGHGCQFLGSLRVVHLSQRDHALGDVHGDVADALEVVGDFQRSDNQAHFVVGERTAAQQGEWRVRR